MKRWISNVIAILWFFGVVIWMLLLLPIVLLTLPGDINSIMESGFGTQTVGFTFLFLFGLIFGVTMLVPTFRKCFKKLPWLYSYVIILFADVAIVAIATEILNYGYSVQNDTRHTLFFALMIIQIVICRIIMCIFWHKKLMKRARDENEQ